MAGLEVGPDVLLTARKTSPGLFKSMPVVSQTQEDVGRVRVVPLGSFVELAARERTVVLDLRDSCEFLTIP